MQQDALHNQVVRELIKNDVLVVETGCGALASAKCGLLLGEAAMDFAGPGLHEVCEAVGIPPVLHMGSCVDNTRILTVLAQMATEGGLGDDISDIPAVGLAPEWMSEKAMAIGTYAAASGVYVIMGVHNPVDGSETVTHFLTTCGKKLGGKIEFVSDRRRSSPARWPTSTRSGPHSTCQPMPTTSGGAAATGAWRRCWRCRSPSRPRRAMAAHLYRLKDQAEGEPE